MTPGDVVLEWVRDFDAALSPQARTRLERDPDLSQLVARCIETGWTPKALADQVGYRVGWQQPENARDLMVWRLHRAAGDDIDGD